MTKKKKERSTKRLSNPFSTGGGGEHFQAHVQASFVALMLTNGFAPCLPPWSIKCVSMQAKHKGYDTDDVVVEVEDPQSREKRKILIQIKHTIHISENDKNFGEVINAAWSDFNKPNFSKEKDAIALVTGPLSPGDNEVRNLLEWARSTDTAEEFIRKVNLAYFSSNNKRKKFLAFRTKLKEANNGVAVSDENTFIFLRHFHLLGYDLDIKAGVTLALLHSHMGFFVQDGIPRIWAEIVEEVHEANKNAGSLTLENISESLRSAFTPRAAVTLPEEFTKKVSQNEWRGNSNISELITANLLGQWQETNAGDLEMLERMTNTNYEAWLNKVQILLQHPDGPVNVRNGIWNINHRNELFQMFGATIVDKNLTEFRNIAVTILTERDPKFDLVSDQRYAANLFGKTLRYSRSLRRGVAEGLALLGNEEKALVNCSQVESTVILSIREIFKNANWELWASLSRELPTLAEASPDEFLKAVEFALQQSPCPFDELFAQESKGLFGESYLSGLCWALESLAWDENFLIRVTLILGELDSRDPGGQWSNRPGNSLTAIFMPFYPQTMATIPIRKTAIEILIKEFPTVAWKLLLTLLPDAHKVSTGTHKPKWRKLTSSKPITITQLEYDQQNSNYIGLALKLASGNLQRLNDLVEKLDDLPKVWFDKALILYSSKKVVNKSEAERHSLWRSLTAMARKHHKFSDTNWALPPDAVLKIENAAAKISPQDEVELAKPLFDGRDYDHYDKKSNWNDLIKRLDGQRVEVIKSILAKKGIKSILQLATSVDSPSLVGSSLSKLRDSKIDRQILPRLLDTDNYKLNQFVNGFVWGRVENFDWAWADKLNKLSWSKLQIAKLLSFLPFVHQTWSRVKEWLGDYEKEYWILTAVNPYLEKNRIADAVDNLVKYGRPRAAIQCLYRMLYDNQPMDANRTVIALMGAINSTEPLASFDAYSITELIKSLQADPVVEVSRIEMVEWAYLQLLDHDDQSPKFLEKKLATDPDFFCEIIAKIYRSKKEPKTKTEKEVTERDQTFATNAWRLLNAWHTAPGFASGIFFKKEFQNWFKKVKSKCSKSGHLNVAFTHFGQVLFYSPPDQNDLWINRTVVDALNGKDAEEIRRGFYMEAHNSRGAHIVDPSGKPELLFESEYREKASKIESAGYHRFAITLREIAESFKRQAERIRKDHNLPE